MVRFLTLFRKKLFHFLVATYTVIKVIFIKISFSIANPIEPNIDNVS